MSLRKIVLLLGTVILLVALAGLNYADEPVHHQYVGVGSCKGCHSVDAVGGTQYLIYKEGFHAKAFETLASDQSKEVAAKAGVEGNPQEADACLKCHVTAWTEKADLRAASWKKEDGVGCETCHGAGKDYMTMDSMKDKEKAVANGLLTPDKELCVTCHNEESPTYKEFKYDEMLLEIKHWKDKAK